LRTPNQRLSPESREALGLLKTLRRRSPQRANFLLAAIHLVYTAWHTLEYLALFSIALISLAWHPAAPLVSLVGLIGLRNRQRISAPALRFLLAACLSTLCALQITLSVPGPGASFVAASTASALTAMITTAAYLVRPGRM
jgi:xanthosine utilization system XapX-like protein